MAESTTPLVGSGASLAFTTNDYAVRVTSASVNEFMSRPSVDTTYLGSTWREAIPGNIPNPGVIEAEFQCLPSELDALKTHITTQTVDTMTVTFDIESGETSAASFSASGFIIDHSITIATEELVTGTMSIQLSGEVTVTAGA